MASMKRPIQKESAKVKPASMNDLNEIENVVFNDTTEQPIRQHFSAALKILTAGKEADYRQAIIEAIAAVDWMLLQYPSRRVNGEAELPITTNPNMMFSIRYALQEESIVITFEKARYWLAVCASSINYLKGLSLNKAQ
jgi:hypothetical protein